LSVAAFPETVTQDRNRGGAGCLIRRRKVAPDNRPLAQQPERIGTDLCRVITLWNATRIGEGDLQIGDSTHALERPRLGLPVDEIWIGNTTSVSVILSADVQDAIIPLDEPEALEENRIGHGEDRGVDADAEGEREDRDRREAGTLPHHANRVTQIRQERFQ